MIGHPYERGFNSIVSNNMIQNRTIYASDVTNAHTIYGNYQCWACRVFVKDASVSVNKK